MSIKVFEMTENAEEPKATAMWQQDGGAGSETEIVDSAPRQIDTPQAWSQPQLEVYDYPDTGTLRDARPWRDAFAKAAPFVFGCAVVAVVVAVVGATWIWIWHDDKPQSSPTSEPARAATPPVTVTAPAPTNATPVPTTAKSAGQQLQEQANTDKPAVDAMAGYWVPQLSSKQPGTHDDGIVYDDNSIWQEHIKLRQQYGAELMWVNGYWVTIADTSFNDKASAQAWCDHAGRDADHCFPRLLGAAPAAAVPPGPEPTYYIAMAGAPDGPTRFHLQWRTRATSLTNADQTVLQDCEDSGYVGCRVIGQTTQCMAAARTVDGQWFVGYGTTPEAAVSDTVNKAKAAGYTPNDPPSAHCAWDS